MKKLRIIFGYCVNKGLENKYRVNLCQIILSDMMSLIYSTHGPLVLEK